MLMLVLLVLKVHLENLPRALVIFPLKLERNILKSQTSQVSDSACGYKKRREMQSLALLEASLEI